MAQGQLTEAPSMRHIRTIQGAVDAIRAVDPGTAITAHHLRALVRSGAIPSQRAGCKYLVAVEDVIDYFKNKGVKTL